MTTRRETSRRYLMMAIASTAIAIAILLIKCPGFPGGSKRLPRHAVTHRVRHTAKAHNSLAGSVGVMIAFVPRTTRPDSGWTTDTKLPLSEAPDWLTNGRLPFVLDSRFGTIPVMVPVTFTATVASSAAVRPGVPPVTQPTTPSATAVGRNRVGVFAVRGTAKIEDLPILAKMLSGQTESSGLYSDPPIVSDADPDTCPLPPKGNADDVAKNSGAAVVASSTDVLLAIVDLGFDFQNLKMSAPGVKFNSGLSSSASPAYGAPGDSQADEHGNMCAYDATLVATSATLIDIRVGDPKEQRLSDAVNAYNLLYAKLTADSTIKDTYQGMVLSNSWGLWSPDDALPADKRYFDNPQHPFTLMVAKMIAEGVDVVFSAGDSADCPPTSTTQGTIWGANSFDGVISVAAVDVTKARIVYSSEGPGALTASKPDLSSYSHFVGSDDGDQDTGTSASAAVVAGIVAAIRSQSGWGWKSKTPAELKLQLIATADPYVMQGGALTALTGWSRDFGAGVARVK